MLGDMGSFLLSFAFNFLVAFLVVRFIYYPSTIISATSLPSWHSIP